MEKKKKYYQLNLDFTIRPEDLDDRPQHVIDEEKVDEEILERHDRRQREMFDDPDMNWSGLRQNIINLIKDQVGLLDE